MSAAATVRALADYAALTRAGIAEQLDQHPSAYLTELARDYPRRGGKGLRPALLLATCQAYGGALDAALPAAVSLEMLHNAFLIHDDVEDGSAERRGSPALHELHGVGLAVNAGDGLAQLALEPVHRASVLGPRLVGALLAELRLVVRQATQGQALELGWRRDGRTDLTEDDYLEMAGRKTCWYSTVAPLRMGAIVGSAGTASLTALTRFGYYLGLAFQIRDDLLDVEPVRAAEPDLAAETDPTGGRGQPGDIAEGKPTLMLIHLLAHADPDDRRWLVDLLRAPSGARSAADVTRVRELMGRYGSLRFAEDYGTAMESEARRAWDTAFGGLPDSEHVQLLRDLVPYVSARTS